MKTAKIETRDLSHIDTRFKNFVTGKSRDIMPDFIKVGVYVENFDFVITRLRLRSDDVEVAEGYQLSTFKENGSLISKTYCAHHFHNPLFGKFKTVKIEDIASQEDYDNYYNERQHYWSNLPQQDLSMIEIF